VNKNLKRKFPIGLSIVGYFILLYLTCFISAYLKTNIEETLLGILPILPDIIMKNPLNIFPLDFKLIGIMTFIYFIFILYTHTEFERNKKTMPGKQHGSAEFMSESDMKRFSRKFMDKQKYTEGIGGNFKIKKTINNRKAKISKNILFTKNIGVDYTNRRALGNFHCVLLGGSGSGKSFRFMMPNLLQASGCSYIITDPKGELLNKYGKYLEKQGYKVKVFNLDNMEHSCAFNPFMYLRDSKDVTKMVNAFMANTDGGEGVKKGDIWDKLSTIQLEAAVFLIMDIYPPEKHNWFEVANILRKANPDKDENGNIIENEIDLLFNRLNTKKPGHIAYIKWQDFKSIAKSDATVASALGSTIARLSRFGNEEVRKITSFDNVELDKIGTEKTALFCITPATDDTYNFLIAMMYIQLFDTLVAVANRKENKGKLPVYCRFLLDEFANIARIPDFDKYFAYMRSFGVSITIAIQNLAQLKAMYEKQWQTILGNADSFLFLGTTENETAEYISKRLGAATINDKERTGKNNKVVKYRHLKRNLMEPNEILLMEEDECILFLSRRKPIFDKKIDTLNLPNFKYAYDGIEDEEEKAEMWYDMTDYQNINEAYDEYFKNKSEEEVIELEEGLEEEMLNNLIEPTIEELEEENNYLEDRIGNRDKNTLEEIRTAHYSNLKKNKGKKIEIYDLSDTLEDNFDDIEDMDKNLFLIDSFSPEFEYDLPEDFLFE